jgi:hypothetical protein
VGFHFVGEIGCEVERLAVWQGEAQAGGVEHEAGRGGGAVAIQLVAEDGAAEVFHMGAELVHAACFGAELD